VLQALQLAAPLAGAVTGLAFLAAYRESPLLMVAMAASVGAGLAVSAGSTVVRWTSGRGLRRAAARRYLEYLAVQEATASSVVSARARWEARAHPGHAELLEIARLRRRVWEREPGDGDWLEVRLGRGSPVGSGALVLEATDPLAPPPDPDLLAAAHGLVERFRHCADGPTTVDLGRVGTLVLGGGADRARGVARSLLCQVAVLHSPADVRMVVVLGERGSASEWDWIKWLPHARPAGSGAGAYAAACPDVAVVSAGDPGSLERLLTTRSAAGAAGPSAVPHLVAVVDGWTGGRNLPAHGLLRALTGDPAASMIHIAAGAEAEAVGAGARLAIAGDGQAELQRSADDATGPERVVVEPLDRDSAAAIARLMAPLRPPRPAEGASERRSAAPASLVAALGIGGPAASLASAGRPSGPDAPLRTPIGLSGSGDPLVLDVREAAQGGMGPHGMLVGATGSGKSELLRTLVAGLVLTHPPDLLALVLVDFKGGAAFQPLAGLPHVAGIVTNLEDDPTMVERFRLAVQGEVLRRQALFKAAGNVSGIGEYRRRQLADRSLESLPHLLLVVDELAELLTHHPELDAYFEQVARLGRALGVHLLVATQGLTATLGRLDRHLSYRLCLRTNSVQESLAVLGSPGAARLPLEPGLGFLKVAQGEPQSFRAFLVSGPCRPPDLGAGGGSAPRVLDFSVARDPRPAPAGDHTPAPAAGDMADGARTELEMIVRAVAGSGAVPARPVWVAPLPAAVPLDRLLRGAPAGSPLRLALGLADLPLEQRQLPWIADLGGSEGHVAVVGAPRSGRSTALRIIAASILVTQDPALVQLYVLDIGGALAGLGAAPHVGAVAGRGDAELAQRIVRRLRRLAGERVAEMRQLGVSSIEELRTTWRDGRPAGGFGDAVLLIDNWGAATREIDGLEEEVSALAATALSAGIHIILSADRWGDIRPALRDRIPGRVQLRPLDPGDSAYDAQSTRALARTPGRALVTGGVPIQIALPRLDGIASADGADAAFRDLVVGHSRPGPAAPPIPVLPDDVPLAGFDWQRWRSERRVPLGLADTDLRPVALDLLSRDTPSLLVSGDPRSGRSSFLRALLQAMTRIHTPDRLRLHIVAPRRSLVGSAPATHVDAEAASAPAIAGLAGDLRRELERRSEVCAAGAGGADLWHGDRGPAMMVVVDDDDTLDPAWLRPLVAHLPTAWEVGLHVVMARRPIVPGYESLAAAVLSTACAGIELSAADRSLFVPRPRVLPPGRAHVVVRGETTLLQLIHEDAESDRSPG
jgi:S-DNA-T family DNA segregation ATPase FtsK/SpoIIIE